MPILLPLILAGGAGTRLQPLSTPEKPKQFLKLLGQHSLLQQTLLRLRGLPDVAKPIVVAGQGHRALLHEQLAAIQQEADLLLEPMSRNTAPAIIAAACWAREQYDNPTLLVLPSDHHITNIPALHEAFQAGKAVAGQGRLVTFGVQPTYPATGYGYIQVAHPPATPGATSSLNALNVTRFVEKPDQTTAQNYLQAGGYYWNSGMFVFTAQQLLEQAQTHCPQELALVKQAASRAIIQYYVTMELNLSATPYQQLKPLAIDRAIMEKSDQLSCIPLATDWVDVGTWEGYRQVKPEIC